MTTATVGGIAGTPALIDSVPNSGAALDGNDAEVRVIIEGSGLPSGSTGFVLDTSHSYSPRPGHRWFQRGVSIPSPTRRRRPDSGNFIGVYDTFLVDPQTGAPCRRIRWALPASATRIKEFCWLRERNGWRHRSPGR